MCRNKLFASDVLESLKKMKNFSRKTCWKNLSTVADWDSMGRAVTQTRGRAFSILSRVFQTLSRAFDFPVRLQKLG